MEEFKKDNFETSTFDETVSFLHSDSENGLSDTEAKERLAKYGPNKLEEKKKIEQKKENITWMDYSKQYLRVNQ